MRTVKISISLLILMSLSPESIGCVISPFSSTAHDAEERLTVSDIAFFGKLTLLEFGENGRQVATFQVIKYFKGDGGRFVQIKNEEISSSCFRQFVTIESAYYVFGSLEKNEEESGILSFVHNGFIPLEWAVEFDWSFPGTRM